VTAPIQHHRLAIPLGIHAEGNRAGRSVVVGNGGNRYTAGVARCIAGRECKGVLSLLQGELVTPLDLAVVGNEFSTVEQDGTTRLLATAESDEVGGYELGIGVQYQIRGCNIVQAKGKCLMTTVIELVNQLHTQ